MIVIVSKYLILILIQIESSQLTKIFKQFISIFTMNFFILYTARLLMFIRAQPR